MKPDLTEFKKVARGWRREAKNLRAAIQEEGGTDEYAEGCARAKEQCAVQLMKVVDWYERKKLA